MSCSFSFALHHLLPTIVIIIIVINPTPVFSSTEQHPTKNQTNKTVPSTMEPLELETLFKIMETLSSDMDWRLSYPNPCRSDSSWPGIECKYTSTTDDSHLHVTRLDFGTPPYPSCSKSASFPPEIFRLPHLESIFIHHCFTHTPTRILTPSNKQLTDSTLQQLSFRSNPALIGPIPSQLSSLDSLQILTLSQNGLTGRIPVQIFSLGSLLHLDLSYNTLTGSIPIQVGNIKNLVGLDLSYNKLVGQIPSAIGNLRVVQKLDLSSNSLTGNIPDTIEHLRSLVFLAMSNNRLRGPLPRGLTGLDNLQYFLMDNNPMFVSLPLELGQLKKLQELRLSNSEYSGTIPSEYSQLMNLSSLSLQNNRLSGHIPSGFANLTHIFHMNLSRNFLDGVVPFGSEFLKRLGRNLDLRGNPGLCLSPSSVHGVNNNNNIGVDACGNNKTASSIIKPLKKSDASLNCSNIVFCYSFWIVCLFF
ncbi:hypothetical protein OROGR_000391 [Orobanche gracilis]